MKKSVSLCVAIGILSTGGSLVSADEPSGIYLSPMAGYYLFDEDRKLDDDLMYSLGLGYKFANRWAAEVNVGKIESSPKGTPWNINALYHLTDPGTVRPYLTAGVGALKFKPKNAPAVDEDQLNAGAGLMIQLVDNLSARADVRGIYGTSDKTMDAAAGLGLHYLFGHTARAEPERDSDGDGVNDKMDQCPGTAAGVRVDALGCEIVLDADNDGVIDANDRCPGTPAGVKVDAAGCALKADSDNDGVADDVDQCPNTQPGVVVDASGCMLDADGDGVADAADACPNTPAKARVDATGCTIKLTHTVSVSLNVEFASGKADVPAAYRGEVEKLAEFLTQYPDTKVVIEGHTDDRGADAINQRLSQARADAVRKVLVQEMGIAADRVSSAGYGKAKPIADNATAEGRQKNRRVVGVVSATVAK